MGTMTLHFAIPPRAPRVTNGWGHSMLSVGRRLADKLTAMRSMTAQDRADHYVARLPIAVLTR
jgi:hypothetical protein